MSSSDALALGIDVGTSGTKAIVVAPSGRILAEASVPHPLHSPRPGWNEQHPEEWWRATETAVGRVLASLGKLRARVRGIGLSGQMHGSVFLDREYAVIRPALLWNDQRTARQCEEMTALVGGEAALLSQTLNRALPGFTAPKVLWLRDEEPSAFRKLRRVILPKDYVGLKLTGRAVTDVSDASGTLFFDVARRRWSASVLARLGLDPTLLPETLESVDTAGTLRPALARKWGLRPATVVVAGAGDQPAAALGLGIVREGLCSATLGTSGVAFTCSNEPASNPGGRLQSFCHAVPGKWCVFGCMLSAGGAVEWLAGTLYPDEPRAQIFDRLAKHARKAPAGSEGLYFLPYLEGERCPHADPDSRAGWVGLNRHHDLACMTRAVFEGVTFGMSDQLLLFQELGLPVREVRCAGGGAKSRFWLELQADTYGVPVVTTATTEASALGAALLGGVAGGVWPSISAACAATVRLKLRLLPDRRRKQLYRRRHETYRSLYPALKPAFEKMAHC